ncbi:hypothetical protein D3C80_1653140 [compost metagenome]
MVPFHLFIDSLQQILRQRRIESHGLAQIGCDIEIHNRPYATYVVWIRYMDIDSLCLRPERQADSS